MPEVAAGLHIRRPGQPGVTSAWAEEFFHSQAEAFDTIKRRLAEHPAGRVHPALASRGLQGVRCAWICCDPPGNSESLRWKRGCRLAMMD